jgi:hypothetical protein
MKFTNKRNTILAAFFVAALSGGVAQAAIIENSGAKASNEGNTLTVKDLKADGDDAYANWNYSGANRVTTSGGMGATASVTVSPLTSFRACIDQGSLNPDNCTSYTQP